MNCPNCQQAYNNSDTIPKILVKCGHTFCIKCLDNIQQSKDNETETYLSCPTCHEETIIGDINDLPKNIALLESSRTQGISSSNAGVNSNSMSKPVCKIHLKDIEAFCETDRTMLCVSCIIENSHKNHDLSSIEKAAEKERAAFEKGFLNALQIEKELNSTLNEIEEIKAKLIINSESNINSIEQFYNSIREILHERETNLKRKIETVLDKEIDFFQESIDSIKDQVNQIKKMKIEKDNFDYLNEFEVLKKSKENNENLKIVLNKPPKINRDVVFYELKKEEEMGHILKIIQSKFHEPHEDNTANTMNISNISSIANNSVTQSTHALAKKATLTPTSTSNFLTNEIRKLENKTKQLVETKSNININPKNNLNAARDSIKSKKSQNIKTTIIQATQIKSSTNLNNYQTNSNVSANKNRTPNIEKPHPQKRNKTPGKFDISDTSTSKTDALINLTTNPPVDNSEKLEVESFNFVGKLAEKEPPKANKQKTLALFPALKGKLVVKVVKISNPKVPQMNKSDIVITDMEAVKGEATSPSFRKDEKHSFQEKILVDLNDTNNNLGVSKVIDETIKLDISTQKHKDNLFDSAINISSQLMATQQSIHTDLASLYKTFNYSILLLGGRPDSIVRKFEIENKSWKEIKTLSVERTDFSAIMYKDKKILLIGGKVGDKVVDTIELINLEAMEIKGLDIKLHSPRANFGSLYHNNKLYIAGGISLKEKEPVNTFEYFDKKSKNWNVLSPMMIKRKEFCLVLSPEGIICIGGSDDKDVPMKSVERYDIEKKCWKKMEEMNQPRKNFSAITMPDGVYVIGGNDGCQFLKSCEKYDFQLGKWKYIHDMNFPRAHFSCVSTYDGRFIYALGGYDGKPINSIERFDLFTNKWEVLNKMPNFKYRHQAICYCE